MPAERLTCGYCGRPFNAGDEPRAGPSPFCGSGCAMAARLGIDGEKFPVTPQLVFDAAYGLAVFNELLLLPLAAVLWRDGRGDAAALCVTISISLGAAAFLAALFWQWRSGWLRAGDRRLYASLAVPTLGGAAVALCLKRGDIALLPAASNLVLALWLARGFLKRVMAKRSRT